MAKKKLPECVPEKLLNQVQLEQLKKLQESTVRLFRTKRSEDRRVFRVKYESQLKHIPVVLRHFGATEFPTISEKYSLKDGLDQLEQHLHGVVTQLYTHLVKNDSATVSDAILKIFSGVVVGQLGRRRLGELRSSGLAMCPPQDSQDHLPGPASFPRGPLAMCSGPSVTR